MDLDQLNKDLDRTKSKVFLDPTNAVFLGSLMCSLEFKWDESIPTSGTDGTNLLWNPDRFKGLPLDSRKTDLCHELWHVALLHPLRRGARDHEIWNIACDIRIDLLLEAQGFTFEGIGGVDRDKKYKDWVEEDIYDDLIKNPPPKKKCTCASHSMPDSKQLQQALINSVVQAMHQAVIAGQAGSLPGQIKETLNKFLEPVIPWQTVLMQFFTDLLEEDYTWSRPNRRYEDMYLPAKFMDEGKLEHLMFFEDVSGSISKADSIRFNSEVKYVQEVLKPSKLTLVQFDTKIQEVKEYLEEEPFEEFKVSTGGGTSLVCVRNYINEHKPTAAIIFSDMLVHPMQKPDFDIPIIWVAINNKSTKVNFGKLIHI